MKIIVYKKHKTKTNIMKVQTVNIDAKTNDVFKYNDLVRLSKLGATLAILGQQGNEAFYNGVLTGFIVTEINENGLDLCVLLLF